jgi:hypothetical protein
MKAFKTASAQVLLGAALKCKTMLACSIGQPSMKGDVSATWSPMNTVKLIRGRVRSGP